MEPKSSDRIPKSVDSAMDSANPDENGVLTGISICNGPVVEMDIDEPAAENSKVKVASTGKRKSRQGMTNGKSYKEASSEADEDDEPLVCLVIWLQPLLILTIDLSQE